MSGSTGGLRKTQPAGWRMWDWCSAPRSTDGRPGCSAQSKAIVVLRGPGTTTLTDSARIAQLADVNSSIGKYSSYFYAIMRIVLGLMFACHGAQKLFGMFGGKGGAQGMMLLGGIIELAGGLLIAFGLLTRPAAFLSSGMMAVAYFMAHQSGGLLPIVNKGELAVIYCFVFLYVFFRGAGPLSLDNMIWGNNRGIAADEVGGPMRTGREL